MIYNSKMHASSSLTHTLSLPLFPTNPTPTSLQSRSTNFSPHSFIPPCQPQPPNITITITVIINPIINYIFPKTYAQNLHQQVRPYL